MTTCTSCRGASSTTKAARSCSWGPTGSPSSTPVKGRKSRPESTSGRGREYQFLYAYFPLLTAYFSPNSPRFGLFDFYEFINSAGDARIRAEGDRPGDIRWADGQATWYKPGHFLKAHTDEEAATGRLAAYVMNLSPDMGARLGRLPPVLRR